VLWKSTNKNNGFVVSFGTDSPFEPDGPIMGGGQKPVTTKAVTPGCYKYDAGAFRDTSLTHAQRGDMLSSIRRP
jgi:predicted amidohydrolase YtcJ